MKRKKREEKKKALDVICNAFVGSTSWARSDNYFGNALVQCFVNMYWRINNWRQFCQNVCQSFYGVTTEQFPQDLNNHESYERYIET